MPVITPRPTGHNAQRWSGIIGAMVVEKKGFKGIHSSQYHSVHAYHRITQSIVVMSIALHVVRCCVYDSGDDDDEDEVNSMYT